MEEKINQEILSLILNKNLTKEELEEKLKQYHESDIAEAIPLLSEEERNEFFNKLTIENLGELLTYVESPEDYIEEMEPSVAADIVETMDADDAVAEGIVSAIRMAKEKDADMVAYHHAFANEEGVITKEAERLSFAAGQVFSGIEIQNAHPYWCSGPVAYVYNRAFLDRSNYPFREGVLYEDSDFVVNHLYDAKRMAYSAELGYIAYYREGSTTHSTSYKNTADYLLLGTRMLSLYERVMYDVSCIMYDVPKEDVEKFAEGILEGACFNIERSCRRILKLNSLSEVRAYYDRVDAYTSRRDVIANKHYRTYYWNAWTGACVKHKRLAIGVWMIVRPVVRLLMK